MVPRKMISQKSSRSCHSHRESILSPPLSRLARLISCRTQVKGLLGQKKSVKSWLCSNQVKWWLSSLPSLCPRDFNVRCHLLERQWSSNMAHLPFCPSLRCQQSFLRLYPIQLSYSSSMRTRRACRRRDRRRRWPRGFFSCCSGRSWPNWASSSLWLTRWARASSRVCLQIKTRRFSNWRRLTSPCWTVSHSPSFTQKEGFSKGWSLHKSSWDRWL